MKTPYPCASVGGMNPIRSLPQAVLVTFALMRGLGELVALQRWRMQGWLARRLS